MNIIRIESITVVKFENEIINSITETEKRCFKGIIIIEFVRRIRGRRRSILKIFESGELKSFKFSEVNLVGRVHKIVKIHGIIGRIKRNFINRIEIKDKDDEINRFSLYRINESKYHIIVRGRERKRVDILRSLRMRLRGDRSINMKETLGVFKL